MSSDPSFRPRLAALLAGASLTAALLAAPPAAVADDEGAHDWPMWRYDAARSGISPMELPETLHLQWARDLGEPVRAWPAQHDDADKLEFDLAYSPVVLGDRLFVGSMTADHLAAYNVNDGEELWRHYVDGPVRLAPAAWEDRVFFVSDDGHLHCVSAETGEPLWNFRAAPRERLVLGNNRLVSMWAARGGPVVDDGIVYFAAGVWPFMGTFVYALDASTGEIVWQNTGDSTNWQAQPHGGAYSFAGIAPQGYIAVGGDRLVVSGGRSPAGLLDRSNGELLALDITGKDWGGYQVHADETHFYNHGRRFRLEDGRSDGSGELHDEDLIDLAASLAAAEGEEVFEALKARGRLFVSTLSGAILCYGAEVNDEPARHRAPRISRRRLEERLAEPASDERVARIVEEAPSVGKNVLFLGVEDGELLAEVALRTGLHVVGIDDDAEKIERLRQRLGRSGLYGARVALLPGDPASVEIPPYLFSFIVASDAALAGRDAESVRELLRPYGGVAFLGQDEVVTRDGPLPGAGEWTHQYADAARTAISHDDLVKAPLGVLWYGADSHDNILPRHAAGPRPQVAGGRLLILGVESISARDVYTGQELWIREFPGIGHPFTDMELEERWRDGESVYMTNIPGAAYIGSPYVTLADSAYLRYRGEIHHLDPATGETRGVYALYPEEHRIDPADWGPVSVSGNYLITTTGPHIFDDTELGWLESYNATSSRHLLVLDRRSGEVLWQREAEIGFRHNAIVAGEDRLFVIDGLSEKGLEFLERRGTVPEENSRIFALDLASGEELWTNDSQVFGTYLAFSEAHDILMESGSRDTRRPLADEPTRQAFARDASNGEILWEGDMQFPAAIRGDTLIPARPGKMLHIATGEEIIDLHPITGEPMPESYTKFYGCSPANASTHLLLFRSGSAGFIDLDQGGGTANLGGFKTGCTSNLIVADGILNAPDYTRTCTCNYQNQTSLGLVHMPDADHWTSVDVGRGEGAVQRLGVNLGAPGNRRADDGTLWVPFPVGTTPAPELELLLHPEGMEQPPLHLVRATASGGIEPTAALDGDSSTSWSMECRGRGTFRQHLHLGLNETTTLDRVEVAWSGPEGTEFRIEASVDGERWIEVAAEASTGSGRDRKAYEFDPIPAKELRLGFGDHADESVDSRGRRRVRTAQISEVIIGGLEWPEAYAYFVPKDMRRLHPLEVEAGDSLDWVGASRVAGVTEVILGDLQGGDRPYTVTLHFAEIDGAAPGERVFDIAVQGETVAEGFDIAAEAGAERRGVTRRIPGVVVGDALRIDLRPADGSELPPAISGFELVLEAE